MNAIDRCIAENVMNWKPSISVGMENPKPIAYKDQDNVNREFKPSTKIQDAWFALDVICEANNWRAVIDRNQKRTEIHFETQMGTAEPFWGDKETPMLAICDVLLKTAEIELDSIIEKGDD